MTLADSLAPKMERAYLLNLDNSRRFDFLLNPETLSEKYPTIYKFHSSLGLSHERMQYVGNQNARIPLEARFDQFVFFQRNGRVMNGSETAPAVVAQNEVDEARRQLLELAYPRRGTRVRAVSPPPVLFYWPGLFNMRVRVTELEFNHILFETGRPLPRVMIAKMVLVEEPLERIWSEDALRSGTWRRWAGSSTPRRR